jgi:hypothetical protein
MLTSNSTTASLARQVRVFQHWSNLPFDNINDFLWQTFVIGQVKRRVTKGSAKSQGIILAMPTSRPQDYWA